MARRRPGRLLRREPPVVHFLPIPADLLWAGFCRWCARPVPACGEALEHRRRFEVDPACAWCRSLARASADCAAGAAPVVQGTVVGVVPSWGTAREIVLLPFSYERSRGAFSWELHHLVHAGDSPAGLRPLVDLGAVCGAAGEPDVRVHALASCHDPLVSARLSCNALVVALSGLGAALAAELFPSVASPPSFGRPRVVDLEEAIPWAGAFGRPLSPLGDFLRAEGLEGVVGSEQAFHQSALRQAALVVRLLELAAGCNLFERWLVAGRRPAADDSSDEVV